MKKITIEDGGSLSLIDENLVALKAIFPTAFSENGIDFDALRTLLGGEIVDSAEKYGLNWHGKKNVLQVALSPSFGALRPCREESVDWDSTQNMFIEGDNLEVLKLLQRSYSQKIKMIYIDPPYNTGKEFIYPDKWQDNLDTYLRYTGQIDESGDKFSTNTETDGRYHTNWLNMMYPRLKMAWNLLSDDGVIFISIDDNEQANLKILCDEIFGEDNFISSIMLYANPRGRQSSDYIADSHEYVLVYAKDIDKCAIKGMPLTDEEKAEYNKEDEFGKYREIGLRHRGSGNRKEDSPTLHFPIYYCEKNNQIGVKKTDGAIEIIPRLSGGELGRWSWSKDKILKDNSYLLCKKVNKNKENERYDVYRKDYLTEDKLRKVKSAWLEKEINYDKGAARIRELFGKKIFGYSKPPFLLKKILAISTDCNNIILDFFAGSCTIGDAIMQLNAEDGGNRRCISVQLPEEIKGDSEAAKLGYKNIAELGRERIRRAAAHIKNKNPNYEGDLGFKVFKLDTSNLQVWNPNKDDLENTLLGYEENIKQDRSEEDVLYELLQKCGEDFATQIKIRKVADKTIHAIGDGAFLACMDKTITEKDVEAISKAIIKWRQELNEGQLECYVYFRDNAFSNDSAKINMDEILQQSGISHVRSL